MASKWHFCPTCQFFFRWFQRFKSCDSAARQFSKFEDFNVSALLFYSILRISKRMRTGKMWFDHLNRETHWGYLWSERILYTNTNIQCFTNTHILTIIKWLNRKFEFTRRLASYKWKHSFCDTVMHEPPKPFINVVGREPNVGCSMGEILAISCSLQMHNCRCTPAS